MPELPEVETLKRELAKVLAGKRIANFRSDKFRLDLVGQKITGVERRAKILIINLDTPCPSSLLVHLKMTGQLIYVTHPLTPSPKGRGKPEWNPLLGRGQGEVVIGGHPQSNPLNYTRAVFDFTDGSRLYFNDLRKFGWMKLLSQLESQKIFDAHGVEPLSREFTEAKFAEILRRYPNRKIKQLLLDQTLIAGLGNIYADEACFLAGVLPTRRVESLTKVEKQKLRQSIIEVLKLSIKKKGSSARNYLRANGKPGGFVPHLQVYGRAGEPCKVCGLPAGKAGSLITKIKLNGRGTHFCKNCQK